MSSGWIEQNDYPVVHGQDGNELCNNLFYKQENDAAFQFTTAMACTEHSCDKLNSIVTCERRALHVQCPTIFLQSPEQHSGHLLSGAWTS